MRHVEIDATHLRIPRIDHPYLFGRLQKEERLKPADQHEGGRAGRPAARAGRQWRRTLRTYILPVLGKLDVELIDTEAVLQVLEPIWSTIPETASRVRGRIETVLDFAGRSGANPARWKGHLEHKLVKRNKARTVRHLPALPYTEMGAFMAALRAVNSIPARA